MCIIISKSREADLPKKEYIMNSFINNPDGAGFLYTDGDEVVIDKGYMDLDSFMDHYKLLCKRYNNFKNKSLILHFRIATSGLVTGEYCHPFVLCNNYDIMKRMHYKSAAPGVVHNGVISACAPKNKIVNDSMIFIKKYLYKFYKKDHNIIFKKYFKNIIAAFTNSKFAILNNNDKISMIGDFIEEDGVFYSNSSYKNNYFLNNYDDDYIILNDYTSLIYEGFNIQAQDLRTKKGSILKYNYYYMEVIEELDGEIINYIDGVDVDDGSLEEVIL